MDHGDASMGGAAGHRTFGMSYEDFVGGFYATMVSLGRPTRDALRELGLSEEEIHVGTSEAVARGFVREVDTDTWEVLPPRAAFNAYAAGVQHRLALAQSALDHVEALWRQRQDSATTSPGEGLTMFVGHAPIVDQAIALHQGAVRRLAWVLDDSPTAHLLLDRAAEDPELLRVREGVGLRACLDTRLLDHPASVDVVEQLQRDGALVTLGNGVPFSLHISDDVALIDLSAHSPEGHGSCSTTIPGAVAAATAYLDAVMNLATAYLPTVDAYRPDGDGVPLDARDRRILGLLTVGASDQVIARQLGVSVRTIERRVRYLMDHLGAASRFQAGVQAVRRGWV